MIEEVEAITVSSTISTDDEEGGGGNTSSGIRSGGPSGLSACSSLLAADGLGLLEAEEDEGI